MIDERESFLRAIFDASEDDMPRLVFADWLEERGEGLMARAIRHSIEIYRNGPQADPTSYFTSPSGMMELLTHDQIEQLQGVARWKLPVEETERIFSLPLREFHTENQLKKTLTHRPLYYTAKRLTIRGDGLQIRDEKLFDLLFSSSALRSVNELVICGDEIPITGTITDDMGLLTELPVFEIAIKPMITLSGVESLARHRGASRLIGLDLRHNQLGNDALRSLARSPYLDSLKYLRIAEGNQFRGRVWQLLIERFGELVVS